MYRVLEATLPSLRHVNQYVLLLLLLTEQQQAEITVHFLPGYVFPGNVQSGKVISPENVLLGNVFPGVVHSGKVTFRETTINRKFIPKSSYFCHYSKFILRSRSDVLLAQLQSRSVCKN